MRPVGWGAFGVRWVRGRVGEVGVMFELMMQNYCRNIDRANSESVFQRQKARFCRFYVYILSLLVLQALFR